MKKLLTRLFITSTTVAITLLFSACGGGGSSSSDLGSVSNDVFDPVDGSSSALGSDAAPTTLDKTKLQLTPSADFAFYFNKTGGSGTSSDPEVGYASSFSVSDDQRDFELPASSGATQTYELPQVVTGVSYTYIKTSTTQGQLTIRGEGTGDGGTLVGSTDNQDTNANANEMDIFVNNASTSVGTSGVFDATIDLSFGSDGSFVNTISAATALIGTSNRFSPSLNITFSTALTSASITTHSGANLPVGYNTGLSSGLNTSSPTPIFPTTLSGDVKTSQVNLLFNTASISGTYLSEVTEYVLTGILGEPNQGFTNVTDQGVATLTIRNSDGSNTSGNVSYGWETNSTSTNVAVLTIINNLSGTSITEQFLMDFSASGTGDFEQTQPTSGTVRGTFTLPYTLNANN